jgi:hypothetical protein
MTCSGMAVITYILAYKYDIQMIAIDKLIVPLYYLVYQTLSYLT